MTPAGVLVEAGSRAAAAWTLRLALGLAESGEEGPRAWEEVLHAATRERCASVAWRRSGSFIRAGAPPAVAGAWRSVAVDVDSRARRQFAAVADAILALEGEGIEVVLLKGAPLSARLYGDPFARLSADGDLWLPAHQRERARGVLSSRGWILTDGEPPWEESWVLGDGRDRLYLDVHSRLLDHNLAHLPEVPVESAPVAIDGTAVRAHEGAAMPAYLAAHASKHRLPPLLWFVDLETLWSGLSAAARAEAVAAAHQSRLGGYLRWGIERARVTRAAACGDAVALGSLGITDSGRHDAHPAVRDLRLAAAPADAVRSLAGWVVPAPLRGDLGALSARFAARLTKLARRDPAVGVQRHG